MSGATPLVLGIAALLALPSGCNDDDDDSGPSDQQVLLVQRATAASGAAGQVVEASNAEILASGSASPGSPEPFEGRGLPLANKPSERERMIEVRK